MNRGNATKQATELFTRAWRIERSLSIQLLGY